MVVEEMEQARTNGGNAPCLDRIDQLCEFVVAAQAFHVESGPVCERGVWTLVPIVWAAPDPVL